MNQKLRTGNPYRAVNPFRPLVSIGIAAMVFLASGCAHLNSIHRTTDISDDGRVISVDSKQRFLVSRYTKATSGQEALRKFCVEPSPDVFSAFAAYLSGSARTKAFEATLNAAFSENAATIGIRTQAIQLLRDGMYRICEGGMNGTVTVDQFVDLHRRYQRIMVTLVAIEQLTGAVRPPSVAIRTDALAGRPARLNELQTELEKARKNVSDLKATVVELSESEFSRPKEGDEGKTEKVECGAAKLEDLAGVAECADYLNATKNLTDAQENEKALVEDIETARSELVNRASGTVTLVNNLSTGSQLSEASVKQVAKTVKEMVDSMFRLDPDTAINNYLRLNCAAIKEESLLVREIGGRIETLDNQAWTRIRETIGLEAVEDYDLTAQQSTVEQLEDRTVMCEALVQLIKNDLEN